MVRPWNIYEAHISVLGTVSLDWYQIQLIWCREGWYTPLQIQLKTPGSRRTQIVAKVIQIMKTGHWRDRKLWQQRTNWAFVWNLKKNKQLKQRSLNLWNKWDPLIILVETGSRLPMSVYSDVWPSVCPERLRTEKWQPGTLSSKLPRNTKIVSDQIWY